MDIITGINSNGKKVANSISNSEGLLVQENNKYKSIEIMGEKNEIFVENGTGISGNPIIGISETPYLEYLYLDETQKIMKKKFSVVKFNKKIEESKISYNARNGFKVLVDGLYRIDLFFKTDIFHGKTNDYLKVYIVKSEKNGVFQEYNSLSYFDVIKNNSKSSYFCHSISRVIRLSQENFVKIYMKSNKDLYFKGNDYTEPPLRINLIKLGK